MYTRRYMYEVMWFVLNVELYILRVEYMYMYDTLHVLHVVHILRVTCIMHITTLYF